MNIFIGGSDASAAALLGEALASHPRMLAFSETSLLGGRSGVADLLRGTCDLAMFERRFFRVRLSELNEAFAKAIPGRYELLPRKSAKRLFTTAFEGQELAVGAGTFARGVNLIAMNEAAKAYWAEIRTLARTDVRILHRLYPGMRYVHLFRSPEESYMATVGENRGPDTLVSFIFDYKRSMLHALSALKTLPAENVIALNLDALIDSPNDLLARILNFCGVSYSQDFLAQAALMLAKQKRTPAEQGAKAGEIDSDEQRLLLKHCQHLHRACQALEQELSGAW
ncbi:sulfotransferase [Desulfocurvibacter africanus]|uniref:sulfotransferase n=1 Tax=Desulfocurvibacter africanus TaxID=873 RepID=UPI00040C6192|nr:sulfotransferase [Desulfocurvibacter africanus]